jgi:hypothetical protein
VVIIEFPSNDELMIGTVAGDWIFDEAASDVTTAPVFFPFSARSSAALTAMAGSLLEHVPIQYF